MESGRGAERLLSPKLRQASARIAILALAVMTTLAIFGCGDDSSDEQTAASTPASQEQAEAGGAASTPASQGKAGNPAGKPSAPSPNPVPGSGREAPAGQGSTAGLPSGEPEKGITPEQRAKATVLSMRLESPALASTATGTGGVVALPAAYTCDGRNTWPELTWRGVPEGTAELALYVMNLQPVEGQLFYGWTVAGLDPSLTGIPSGRLPKGAVEGRNSSGKVGYTICPPQGSSETFLFALYALPEPLAEKSGFDPNAVRKEIVMQAGNSGMMAVSYGR